MKECERSNYGTSGVVKKTLWKFGRGVSNLVEFCFNIWLIWNKHTGKIRVTNSHTVVRKKGISPVEKSRQKNIGNAKGIYLGSNFWGSVLGEGQGVGQMMNCPQGITSFYYYYFFLYILLLKSNNLHILKSELSKKVFIFLWNKCLSYGQINVKVLMFSRR